MPITVGDYSPWGQVDNVEPTAIPGIYFVSTASHGGFYLEPSRRDAIPRQWQEATINGKAGWYEEDLEYAFVLAAFPQLRPELNETAKAMVERKIKTGHWFAARAGKHTCEADHGG